MLWGAVITLLPKGSREGCLLTLLWPEREKTRMVDREPGE